MDQEICIDCRKPKVDSTCGICGEGVCRKCRNFLAEEEFPLELVRPENLMHSYYCGGCNEQIVEPFRTDYNAALEQAKEINVIYRDSKSSFRILRKSKKLLQAGNLPDRDEAILRIAFQAAREGFNAILDVEVSSQKKREAGRQVSIWAAQGYPAAIHSHELDR